MKIIFVLTQSFESPSGLGRYRPIARELVKLEHSVELVALHHNYEALEDKRPFIDRGVKTYYASQMHVKKVGSQKLYFSPPQLLLVSLLAILRMAKIIWQSEADIIHVCKAQPLNIIAARLASKGRPIYVDCDDYEAFTNHFGGKWQQKIVHYFEDSVVRFAEGLTVNTRFLENRFIKLGFPKEKIVYVPNGVEKERFDKPIDKVGVRKQLGYQPDTPIVTFIGSIGLASHPIDLLIHAFVDIKKAIPEAQLMLVGGGQDLEKLQNLAHDLGIGDSTKFVGKVHPDEVPKYQAIATVSVDPVYDDPIANARSPLKVVESLVMGIPVVTSDVGDRAQMLDNGRFGILVESGNNITLSNGIIKLISDKKRYQDITLEINANLKQWYWRNQSEKICQIYAD